MNLPSEGEIVFVFYCLLVVFFHLPFWRSSPVRKVMNFVDRVIERFIVGLVVAIYYFLVLFGWAALVVAVLRGGLR